MVVAHALAAISVLYSLERAYGVLAWLRRRGTRSQTKLPLSSLPEGTSVQMTSVAVQCHCEVSSALHLPLHDPGSHMVCCCCSCDACTCMNAAASPRERMQDADLMGLCVCRVSACVA